MKHLSRYKVFESSESVYSFEDYTRSLNFIKNKVAPYTIVRDFFTESEISVIENSLDYYNYINNYKVNVTANNIPSEDVPNLNVIRIEILVHGNPVIYHLEKWTDGSWKYKRQDGTPWDIYRDGLKIYTTIDANLQEYAEEAVERHLKENLQSAFDDNNRGTRNYPFSNAITDEAAEGIMRSARLNSPRYAELKDQGMSDGEIVANFNTPTSMRVFSWKHGEVDTLMTPNDSIRYYKSFLHAGLISIEPQTGFVKAWVGGANFQHFAFDHVRQGKRQVGSTIKPFVYSTAMAMGVVKPCTQFENRAYCVDLQDAEGNIDDRWCPKNAGGSDASVVTASTGLAQSMNNITVAVMAKMGGYAGPKTISKLLKMMDINLRPEIGR